MTPTAVLAAIQSIHPAAKNGQDFHIFADGKIRGWQYTEPQPTPEQLAAAWDAIKDLPPPPPVAISATQLRVWCIRHAIPLAAIDAAIDSIPDAAQREEARVRWEYSTEVRRDFPLVAQLAAALGMTDAQVDAAFREGATL